MTIIQLVGLLIAAACTPTLIRTLWNDWADRHGYDEEPLP
jgi:hypothetical protein